MEIKTASYRRFYNPAKSGFINCYYSCASPYTEYIVVHITMSLPYAGRLAATLALLVYNIVQYTTA